MTIEVTTAAETEDLVLLDTAKTALGIDLADTSDDVELARIVTRSSTRVRGILGRPITRAAYSERLPGYGDRRLGLSRYPVEFDDLLTPTIITVQQRDVTVDAADWRVGNAELGELYHETGWIWSAPRSGGPVRDPIAGQEEEIFTVTYAAGWWPETYTAEKPSPDATIALPADFEEACLRLVEHDYLSSGSEGLRSERVGPVRFEYAGGSGSGTTPRAVVEQEVSRILRPYR